MVVWLLSLAGFAQETLPVLCYHEIHPRPTSQRVTKPSRFHEQTEYLQKEGYRCVSLGQGRAFLQGKAPKGFPRSRWS